MNNVSHLLGGVMLLCAFAILSQRWLAAMISLYRVEAITLTAAAFLQAYAQGAPSLYLTALITLVIQAIIAPIALRRIVQRLNLTRAVETAIPIWLSMILGVGLIGIAMLAVPPLNSGTLTQEDLAIPLSVILLGILLMTTRRNALAQVIGFLSTANGLILAAIVMPAMPFIVVFSIAILVLAALLIAGVFVFRIRAHLDILDLTGLEELKRRG